MDDTSVDTESTNPPSGEEERSRPFDADAGADEPIGPNNNGDRADNEEVAKAHCRPDVPNYWYDANPDPDEYLSRDDDVVRTSRWSFSAWVPAGDAMLKTMRQLVAEQHDPYIVELIQTNYGSQVGRGYMLLLVVLLL